MVKIVYPDRLAHPPTAIETGRELVSVGLANCGRQVVTLGADGCMQVWDAATGEALFSHEEREAPIIGVVPGTSSGRCVFYAEDGYVACFHSETGKYLSEFLEHEHKVATLTLLDGETKAALGTKRGKVHVFDLSTGEQLGVLDAGGQYPVKSLRESPDGRFAVTTSQPLRETVLWDMRTFTAAAVYARRSESLPVVAEFTPDGQFLILANRYGPTDILKEDTNDFEALLESQQLAVSSYGLQHGERQCSILAVESVLDDKGGADMELSPDGKHFAMFYDHRFFRLYNFPSFDCRFSATSEERIWCTGAFSPDGRYIVVIPGLHPQVIEDDSTWYPRLVGFWDVTTGREVMRIQGHASTVISVEYSRDASALVTGSKDGLVQIWRAEPDQGSHGNSDPNEAESITNWLLDQAIAPGDHSEVDYRLLAWNLRYLQGSGEFLRFVKAGADCNARAPDGRAILHDAIEYGFLWQIEALLENGASPDLPTPEGLSPLLLAIERGSTEVAKALIKAGAEVSTSPDGGAFLLVNAVRGGSASLVDMLLDAGAAIDRLAKDGSLAIVEAVCRQEEAILRKLLTRGANLNARDAEGKSALVEASKAGDGSMANILLSKGAQPDTQGQDGYTALMYAVRERNNTLVSALLAKKADPNILAEDGSHALDLAVRARDLWAVRRLLTQGAIPDASGQGGQNALETARQIDEADISRALNL